MAASAIISTVYPKSIIVRVPATTANIGPGFDCMGMAIDFWNEISVERSDKFSIVVSGVDSDHISCVIDPDTGETTNLLFKALRRGFQYCGVALPPLRASCKNNVPMCSGLGSSSATIVAGLVAGLVLGGHINTIDGIDKPVLLALANEVEGHPDNVAPAIYGGIQLSYLTSDNIPNVRSLPCPTEAECLIFIPSSKSRLSVSSTNDKTAEMRGLLPTEIPMKDVVFNVSRTAMLVDVLYKRDWENLPVAMEDRVHQPYRMHRFPYLTPMVEQARRAGAHGTFLSGAGPSVFTIYCGEEDAEKIEEIKKTLISVVNALPSESSHWKDGIVHTCRASEMGVHITKIEW